MKATITLPDGSTITIMNVLAVETDEGSLTVTSVHGSITRAPGQWTQVETENL